MLEAYATANPRIGLRRILRQTLISLFCLLGLANFGWAKESMMNNEHIQIRQMWNFSNYEESRLRFEAALDDLSDTQTSDYALQLKTQIARTFSLEGQFERAHLILDDVEPHLSPSTPTAKIRYLLERGRTYNSAGAPEKARPLFEQAFEDGKGITHPSLTIDAAHMVAIAAQDLDEKLEWNTKGISEALDSDDKAVRGWIGVFHNNMGWDLFDAKRYEEALVHFESSREFYESAGAVQQAEIAQWSIAKTHRFLGQTDLALEIQTKLLEKNNGLDESGYVYEELAELYLLKNNMEESRAFFRKAYNILSKDSWLVKNEPERIERLRNLAALSAN